MNFKDVKLLYLFSCFMLGVIILFPTILTVISFPKGEEFSELYILDSNHKLESLPRDVSPNLVYTIYLGVGNHMKGLESYLIYVKFRNQTDPLPDSDTTSPLSLQPIYEYRLFLADDEVSEKEVSFSFESVSFDEEFCRVSYILVDGNSMKIEKDAVWDEERNEFYYQLIFELWIYDLESSSFKFHNRYVGLQLNMTTFQ